MTWDRSGRGARGKGQMSKGGGGGQNNNTNNNANSPPVGPRTPLLEMSASQLNGPLIPSITANFRVI